MRREKKQFVSCSFAFSVVFSFRSVKIQSFAAGSKLFEMVLKSLVCLLCAGLRILHFETFLCAKLFRVGSVSLVLVVIEGERVAE